MLTTTVQPSEPVACAHALIGSCSRHSTPAPRQSRLNSARILPEVQQSQFNSSATTCEPHTPNTSTEHRSEQLAIHALTQCNSPAWRSIVPQLLQPQTRLVCPTESVPARVRPYIRPSSLLCSSTQPSVDAHKKTSYGRVVCRSRLAQLCCMLGGQGKRNMPRSDNRARHTTYDRAVQSAALYQT